LWAYRQLVIDLVLAWPVFLGTADQGSGQRPPGPPSRHPRWGVDHDQGGLEQTGSDGEEPQPEGGLELGGDDRPWLRPERLHSQGMCTLLRHDDSTFDGVA
jgi:hypothetical protein